MLGRQLSHASSWRKGSVCWSCVLRSQLQPLHRPHHRSFAATAALLANRPVRSRKLRALKASAQGAGVEGKPVRVKVRKIQSDGVVPLPETKTRKPRARKTSADAKGDGTRSKKPSIRNIDSQADHDSELPPFNVLGKGIISTKTQRALAKARDAHEQSTYLSPTNQRAPRRLPRSLIRLLILFQTAV